MTRAALAIALFATAATAQAPDPLQQVARDGNETYLFRSLLKFRGLKPLTAWPADQRSLLRDTVLIVIGRPPGPGDRYPVLKTAERIGYAGGAVLFATDSYANLKDAFPLGFDVSIIGRQVSVRRTGDDICYENRPDCPFAVPQTVLNEHLAAMTGLKRIATNRPSAVRLTERAGFINTPLLKFSPRSQTSEGPLRDTECLAAISDPDPRQNLTGGAACVLADAGVLTNRMLAASDTDNLAFAFHLTGFLTHRTDGSGVRSNVLVLEDGEIRTDYDRVPLLPVAPPTPPTPEIPWSKLSQKFTDVANQAIDDVQTKDIAGQAAERNFPAVMRWLLGVVAVIAAFHFLRRLAESRRIADATPPVVPNSRSTRDDLNTEHLQEYLIAQFASWGQPVDQGSLAVVETALPRAERKQLEAQLRKLWATASGRAGLIRYAEWKELEPMIREVTASHAAGEWQFALQGGRA
jgi:hypothetical protein